MTDLSSFATHSEPLQDRSMTVAAQNHGLALTGTLALTTIYRAATVMERSCDRLLHSFSWSGLPALLLLAFTAHAQTLQQAESLWRAHQYKEAGQVFESLVKI